MDCSEFLELYTDYRDGCLEDAGAARAVREHLSECEACRRYDAVVCRGVMALRSMDELHPSKSIAFAGLTMLPDSAQPVSHAPAKVVGGLMVAAALALLLWPRADGPGKEPVEPQPIARVEPVLPPAAVVLPQPKPLPIRNIEPRPPVFHTQLRPRIHQVYFDDRAAVPE